MIHPSSLGCHTEQRYYNFAITIQNELFPREERYKARKQNKLIDLLISSLLRYRSQLRELPENRSTLVEAAYQRFQKMLYPWS